MAVDMAQELQRLQQEWPHREQQVEQLIALLQQRLAPDVLVHGPSCTGKTGVVRAVAALRPHAYVRCTRSSKLRATLSSILSQLQAGGGGKRKRAQGYAAPTGSEATLIADLQALCGADAAPSTASGDQQRGAGGRARNQQRVVVLDDVHHLLMADDAAARPGDGAPVLRGLLQLREQAGLALSFVLISGADAGAGALACLGQCCSLQVIAFPQYNTHQLRDLLLRAAPPGAEAGLYARFLESLLLSSTAKVSLCLPDLKTAAAQLWATYIKPLGAQAGQQQQAVREDQEAQLFRAAAPRAAALARTFEPGASAAGIAGSGIGGVGGALLSLQGVGGVAELDLPKMARFLLVAAYIASRNKPTVDKQLFENSSGTRRRGGGRRRGGQQGADRHAEAAKAAELRGAHSFTLQRLLHIYRMLRRADPGSSVAAAAGDAAAAAGGADGGGTSAAAAAAAALFGGGAGAALGHGAAAAAAAESDDVSPLDVDGASLLSSVAGLVSRRLLSGGGGGAEDALGAPRYSCEVPGSVVEQVALELRINLAAYLRYV